MTKLLMPVAGHLILMDDGDYIAGPPSTTIIHGSYQGVNLWLGVEVRRL
jgi:hypothetical protein